MLHFPSIPTPWQSEKVAQLPKQIQKLDVYIFICTCIALEREK